MVPSVKTAAGFLVALQWLVLIISLTLSRATLKGIWVRNYLDWVDLWACPCRTFLIDSTEMERPTLNISSLLLAVGVTSCFKGLP